MKEPEPQIRAILVLGGELTQPDFYVRLIKEHELIIAADHGADLLRGLGIVPHVAVGDFDSISRETMGWLLKQRTDCLSYPKNKDKTDGELALEEAVARGASEIDITAAWGGRLDHTLANLFLLRVARRSGVRSRLVEADGEIILADSDLKLTGAPGEIVSLVPLERCEGVTLRGFAYEAEGLTLEPGDTRGLSNLLINGRGEIMIGTGQVLIIRSRPGRME